MKKLSRTQLEALVSQRINKAKLATKTKTGLPNLTFVTELYPQQREILEHPSKRKALLCGRRWGKTYLIRAALLKAALTDRCNSLFLAPTRIRAEALLWKELEDANNNYSLGATMNQVKLEMVFPNGSLIKLAGCDTETDADKNIRGSSFKLICIDEAGHIGDHLEAVIQRVINATLFDHDDSALWLSGTPNHFCAGYFHDKTKSLSFPPYGWAVWHGTMLDNPKLSRCLDHEGNTKPNWKELVQLELEEEMKREGYDQDSPTYRREYLAQWYHDDSSSVVSFHEEKNLFSHLPPRISDWRYVIGVDFGVVDPFAIIALCWSPETPICYVLDAFQQSMMHGHQQAAKVREFHSRYTGIIVADYAAAGKQHIYDLSTQYKLPIMGAKKQDKIENLERMSDDFRQGRVKVHHSLKDLIGQLKQCVWKDKLKSETTQPDDLLDALHYSWKQSGHFSFRENDPFRKPAHMDAEAWESTLKCWEEEQAFRL